MLQEGIEPCPSLSSTSLHAEGPCPDLQTPTNESQLSSVTSYGWAEGPQNPSSLNMGVLGALFSLCVC